jgi:hypothetical protein
MISSPRIFTFALCPVMGSIGDGTVIEHGAECPVCRQDTPKVIRSLEYLFDGWDGEDIVTATGAYAVTTRLRDAMKAAGVTGVEFRAMNARKSENWDDLAPDPGIDLPEFWQLVVTGRAAGPSGWWQYAGACPACGRPRWEHTDRVGYGLGAAITGKVGPPRQIARGTWDGSHVFMTDDPGPPLVTESVVQLFERQHVKDVAFHPAEWISASPDDAHVIKD